MEFILIGNLSEFASELYLNANKPSNEERQQLRNDLTDNMKSFSMYDEFTAP